MRAKIILPILLLVLAVTAVFIPVARNGFVNIDDGVMLVEYKSVHKLSLENVRHVLFSVNASLYNPLVSLSYMIEHHFGGMDPRVYHATNLVIHALNVILAFLLVYLLSGSLFVSLFSAALFGIHPLHVESVAWITGRKDLLYAFFFLTGLITYSIYAKNGEKKYYIACLFSFLLSLFSKPMAITLPLVLFLIDYLSGRKPDRRNISEKIPFFLLALIFGILALATHYTGKTADTGQLPGIFARAGFSLYGIIFYLGKTLLPVGLSVIYPFRADNTPEWMLVSSFIACLIFASVISKRIRDKRLLFGIIFFLVTIAPVLQLVPVGQGVHGDRYTYIPLLGLFFALGTAVKSFFQKTGTRTRIFLAAGLALYISALGAMTHARTKIWNNSLSLWDSTVKSYPAFAAAYRWRADACAEINNYRGAFADYENALRLNPGFAQAYVSRGNLYMSLGERKKAVDDYSLAIKLDPSHAQAYYNRGRVYSAAGDYTRAVSDYTASLKIEPRQAQCLNNRGVAYARTGLYREALADFDAALELDPSLSEALKNRANVRSITGSKKGDGSIF
ncbi:MAG: tetratricopeptide repeat protein [Elusimicrobiota bacterium]